MEVAEPAPHESELEGSSSSEDEALERLACAGQWPRCLARAPHYALRYAAHLFKTHPAVTLLMALHVPQIASRAARALPRYTDIIVADVAYYACGTAVRAEGSAGAREAFVLLNRCLDLAEAADDDSANLLDYTDFECTDWSRTPLLLESGCVRGAPLEDAREWVLAVSMDQAVEQTLPLDSRGVYAASVSESEACCVLTGYPLGARLVTFTNGRCANREWCVSASASAVLQHIEAWCGPADYNHI